MTTIHCDWCGKEAGDNTAVRIDSDTILEDGRRAAAWVRVIVDEGEDVLDLCECCKLAALGRAYSEKKRQALKELSA